MRPRADSMKTILILIVLLILAAVGGLFYLGQKSSDGAPPGLVEGRLAACPSSPNCVSSEAGTTTSQVVEPLPLASWSRIPSVITDLGGTVTRQDRDYIAAEFTSSLFRFTDDVEFRRAGDAVHVRSASRVGHSDMGANRERVESLREALDGG